MKELNSHGNAGENSPAAREAYQRYLELAPAGPLATRARRAIN